MSKSRKTSYEDFVLCDYQSDDNRILIFASQEARKMMGTIKTLFSDGTFKCCVKPFYQMYSIHSDVNSTDTCTGVVPLIYALLKEKKMRTYELLFRLIKSQIPTWKPDVLIVDCEIATIRAARHVLPNTLTSKHMLLSLFTSNLEKR